MSDKKSLTTYCGLYCPACGIYQGKMKDAANELRRIISAYGLEKEMGALSKVQPAFTNYDKFESVLEALSGFFGSCSNCREGGGPPDCRIRNCAKDRGYSICIDCADMDKCDVLKSYPWALTALQKIRTMGIEKWIKSMDLKVKAGWSYLDEKK
jgi:hypothetical protein